MERMRSRRSILVLAAACTVLTACGGASAGDKAGGDGAPVTLRIGTDDGPERPGAEQIQQFARLVAERSDSQIRIEPVWHAAGEGVDDWDQAVARLVVSRELDMGMIPARAWDTEGVTSLRALHAPFLVTSDELVAQIVTDDVAEQMLAGLETVGITGLALMPEGLRHLFVFGEPQVSPDLDGLGVRAPRSDTTYAALEALGAVPDDYANADDVFTQGVADGTVGAAESSFALAGTLPGRTTAVGNMPLFPKVNSLVINGDAFDDLTAAQQAILRDAAQETVQWAISMTPPNAELAQRYCNGEGRVLLADDADVAVLQQAVAPVYDQLEEDAATGAMIERIRALAEEVGAPADAVAACEPAAVVATATATATAGPTSSPGGETAAESDFPEGTFRMEMPVEFLIEAGVDTIDARNHAGLWTATFADGQLVAEDVNALSGERITDEGVYCVEDGRVSLGLIGDPPTCGDFWSAGWTFDGEELQFTDVVSHHGSDLLVRTLFGGLPWTKIG